MQLQRITRHTKPADRNPSWHVVDAQQERLGRLASRVAGLLQGKHRADYSRHQIAGDFVIVVNASNINVSGDKRAQKTYYRHSGYLGSLRATSLDEMLAKFPERVVERAVKGMLPRNRLGRQMLRRLKVYAGDSHPHAAQINAGTGKASQAKAEAPAKSSSRRRAPKAEAAEQAAPAAVAEETAVEAVAVEEAPAEEQTAPKKAAAAKKPAAKKPAAKKPAASKSTSGSTGTASRSRRRTAAPKAEE